MTRALPTLLLVVTVGCAAKLIRSDAGWGLEGRSYAVSALADGRIMGDGWLLQNYSKVDKKTLQQDRSSEIDMSYSRASDDGYLEIATIEQVEKKTLRTLSERFVAAFRNQAQMVRVDGWVGTVSVDYPVTELAHASFSTEELEAHEAVIEQRHPGEKNPFRTVYLGLVRPKDSKDVISVVYANSPASFLTGMGDVRALVRRLRFGARSFPLEIKPFDEGAPKAFEPVPDNTTRL